VCVSGCPTSSSSSVDCMWNNTLYPGCQGIGLIPTVKIVTFCFPESETIAEYGNLGLGFFEKAMSDLHQTWPIAIGVLFMALIVSIMFLFFVRACGGCLVWTVIILYFLLIISFGVVAFLASDDKIVINGLEKLNDPELLKIIAYCCWGVAGISLLILLCSISKIRIATTVIKTTAEFTR
jgi:hypothetical protein